MKQLTDGRMNDAIDILLANNTKIKNEYSRTLPLEDRLHVNGMPIFNILPH